MPNQYWLSWYHHYDYGSFLLNTPWWISGSRQGVRPADTIVAAVIATDEDAAWEVIRTAYDTPPEQIERRFIEPLTTAEPWTDPDGRFPRADWMTWKEASDA